MFDLRAIPDGVYNLMPGLARMPVEDVKAMLAEIERLQADARRYAYIRDHLTQSDSLHMDGTRGYRFRTVYGTAKTFDDLIDGEIAERALTAPPQNTP